MTALKWICLAVCGLGVGLGLASLASLAWCEVAIRKYDPYER